MLEYLVENFLILMEIIIIYLFDLFNDCWFRVFFCCVKVFENLWLNLVLMNISFEILFQEFYEISFKIFELFIFLIEQTLYFSTKSLKFLYLFFVFLYFFIC